MSLLFNSRGKDQSLLWPSTAEVLLSCCLWKVQSLPSGLCVCVCVWTLVTAGLRFEHLSGEDHRDITQEVLVRASEGRSVASSCVVHPTLRCLTHHHIRANIRKHHPKDNTLLFIYSLIHPDTYNYLYRYFEA